MSNTERVEELAEITFQSNLDKDTLVMYFLEYATLCKDEESIFSFMETNHYGT